MTQSHGYITLNLKLHFPAGRRLHYKFSSSKNIPSPSDKIFESRVKCAFPMLLNYFPQPSNNKLHGNYQVFSNKHELAQYFLNINW